MLNQSSFVFGLAAAALLMAGCQTERTTLSPLEARQAHREAVATIESEGGTVRFADPGTAVTVALTSPEQARRVLNAAGRVTNLAVLNVINRRLTRAQAADLKLNELIGQLPRLRSLLIRGVPLSAAEMRWLVAHEDLRQVTLIDTELDQRGLRRLTQLRRLESLRLVGQPVGDEAVAALRELSTLRRLRLVRTDATLEAAEALVEANPRLSVEVGEKAVSGPRAAW